MVRSHVAHVFVIASASKQQCHALEDDLRAYILQMQESSTPVWCFGVYGNTFEDGCRFTEKSSPVIGDLLRNAPLPVPR